MWSIYLSVTIQGVLTGLVYGLMALGLSVIFGVVRVVNFAHGEFAVVAMYATYVLFRHSGSIPCWPWCRSRRYSSSSAMLCRRR